MDNGAFNRVFFAGGGDDGGTGGDGLADVGFGLDVDVEFWGLRLV